MYKKKFAVEDCSCFFTLGSDMKSVIQIAKKSEIDVRMNGNLGLK